MTSERYISEIDENNAIRIWDKDLPNELNAPFLFQPHHPDGRDWVDKAEAETWLADYISEISKVQEDVSDIVDAEIVD